MRAGEWRQANECDRYGVLARFLQVVEGSEIPSGDTGLLEAIALARRRVDAVKLLEEERRADRVRRLLEDTRGASGREMLECLTVQKTMAILKAESLLEDECEGGELQRLASVCGHLVGSQPLEGARQCLASLKVY